MWKLLAGFALFAALSMYMLMNGGDIDMGGEKHGAEATHAPAAVEAAASK
jgi:hypothetical protein